MLELGIPTLDALFADLPELFQNTAEAWGHEENGMFMNTTVRAQSSVFFLGLTQPRRSGARTLNVHEHHFPRSVECFAWGLWTLQSCSVSIHGVFGDFDDSRHVRKIDPKPNGKILQISQHSLPNMNFLLRKLCT